MNMAVWHTTDQKNYQQSVSVSMSEVYSLTDVGLLLVFICVYWSSSLPQMQDKVHEVTCSGCGGLPRLLLSDLSVY